jgi:solute carrier family 25 (peroxisomal adenine nucleotide transporter), member 17
VIYIHTQHTHTHTHSYEALRRRVLIKGGVSINPLMGFLFGALAKTLATVFTYPLQVIQTRSRDTKASSEDIVNTCSEIWTRRGLAGFFDGLISKLTQTVSNSAFIFMFYEAFLRRAVVFRRSTSSRFTVLSSLVLVLMLLRKR